ncbi:MAG: hypothetical protein WC462_00110 [archaeon]
MKKQANLEIIPIAFVQKGNSFYLEYAISCAKKFNPESKIYVLAEETEQKFNGSVQRDSKIYSDSRNNFKKLYVHRSNSVFEIERFCLERWFILKDFMKKTNLNKVFVMDGDVLLFENISSNAWQYAGFDLTLSSGNCAHATYIMSLNVLEEYCKLVMEYYEKVKKDPSFGKDDSVTDMFFWGKLKDNAKFKVGESTDLVDYSAFDAGLTFKQNNILMTGGMKKIVFQDGLPFGLLEVGAIRLKCLHCQGNGKFFMKYYSTQKFPLFWRQRVEIMKFMRDNFSSKLNNESRAKLKLWFSKSKQF